MILKTLVLAGAVCIGTCTAGAHADDDVATEPDTCPPHCVPGTHEHDVWWCAAKELQRDCEFDDGVQCTWTGEACVPSE